MKIIKKIKSIFTNIRNKRIYNSEIYKNQVIKYHRIHSHLEQLETENRVLEERVASISQKICDVNVQQAPDPLRQIRICFSIDSKMIEQGLLHGNDETVIDYIGRDIGARAAHQIRIANFSRWES